MNFKEYQEAAMRTARRESYPPFVSEPGRVAFDRMTWGLGIAGEAGEVADLLKKGIGHGHGLDAETMKKELGDALWYVTALAHSFGLTLEAVAVANIAKLKARYPDGVFSAEASKNRADVARACGRPADALSCPSWEPLSRGCALPAFEDEA